MLTSIRSAVPSCYELLRFCEAYPDIFELKHENSAIKWNGIENKRSNRKKFTQVRIILLVSASNKNSFSIVDTDTALGYTSLSTEDTTDVTLTSLCVDPCTSVAAATSTYRSRIQPLSRIDSASYAAYVVGFMFRMSPHFYKYADRALPCHLVVEAMNSSHDIKIKFFIQKLAM